MRFPSGMISARASRVSVVIGTPSGNTDFALATMVAVGLSASGFSTINTSPLSATAVSVVFPVKRRASTRLNSRPGMGGNVVSKVAGFFKSQCQTLPCESPKTAAFSDGVNAEEKIADFGISGSDPVTLLVPATSPSLSKTMTRPIFMPYPATRIRPSPASDSVLMPPRCSRQPGQR